MVIQLLVFRRRVSHQCTACNAKVGTCIVQYLIYQEIFLFPTQVGIYTFYIRHEHLTNFGSGLVYCSQCFQQWSLVVECFTGVGDEDCWDTQSLVYNKSWRRYIPCSISTCLEGISDTSIRKARCIRFLLDKKLAGKAFDDISVFIEFDEPVMLFSCSISKRLEPVSIVSYIECLSPTLHSVGNHIGHFTVEWNTFFDGVDDRLVSFARKELLHLLAVEYVGTVIIG